VNANHDAANHEAANHDAHAQPSPNDFGISLDDVSFVR